MSRVKKDEKKTTNEKPVSTGGVDFKELMKAVLNIKPEEKGPKKKPSK